MSESAIEHATFVAHESSVPVIYAKSRVDRVVVHGEGAVITRIIELDDDVPEGVVDICVRGISVLAEGGSVKVVGNGADHVTSVQTDLHVPEDRKPAGPSVEKLRELERTMVSLKERLTALEDRISKWRALRIAPSSNKLLAAQGLKARVDTALALHHFIDTRLEQLDARAFEFHERVRECEKQRVEAAVENMQTSDQEKMGESHPSTAVTVRTDAARASDLSIEYVIPYAAVWYPVYTLRLTESGRAAELSIEAFVAQRTSEDWSNVEMAFATSDLTFDVRLPKLLSLRLGRAQSPPPTGYRPPPLGAERLFDGFDSAFKQPSGAPAPQSASETMQMSSYGAGAVDSWDDEEDDYVTGSYDIPHEVVALEEPMRAMEVRSKSKGSLLGAAANMVADGVAKLEETRKRMQEDEGELAAPPMPSPSMMQQAPQRSAAFAPPGAGGGPPPPKMRKKKPAPQQYGLGDDWLNFDRLVLGSPSDPYWRGKLHQAPSRSPSANSDLSEARNQANGAGAVHPSSSRGMFDYRYEATGRLDVPSDGRLHRVPIVVASGSAKTEFRTVPLRDPAVYRESVLENPHASPLLDGPVDVFLDGQFVSQTNVSFVAKGGKLRIGLGEEDRLKVSRNARVSEESAGLLGGKREITHTVEIELRSGLPFEGTVELLDRIPVTDDDDVDIKFVSSDPPASDYDQKDRDLKVRGGKRWMVSLEPGQKRAVTFTYSIRIKDKEEIVGGNRREP